MEINGGLSALISIKCTRRANSAALRCLQANYRPSDHFPKALPGIVQRIL